MRTHTPIIALLATSVIAFAACSQKSDENVAHAQQREGDSTAADPNANGTAYGSTADPSVPADNTGVNKRDRNDATLTTGDQSQSAADLDLVKKVRQAIEADDTLSANGKNVKVITRDGMVTLRGPVKDENERKSIGDKATMIAGEGKVQNLLEVAR